MTCKRILNSKLIMLLILFALFPPDYLMRFGVVESLVTILRISAALLVFAVYFQDFKMHWKKKYNLLLLALFFELLLSTLLKNVASLNNWLVGTVITLTFCFFVEDMLLRNAYKLLCTLYYYFSTCVLINLATVFLFPDAMYANNNGFRVCWFLGEDNGAYIYYIIASMMAMLYQHFVRGRTTILGLLVYISSFVFVLHNSIATGIVCQIIWLFLVVIVHSKLFSRYLRARQILYIALGGFVLLVVTRQLLFEPIIKVLGRQTTITGRTVLWDRVLSEMSKHALLGYGLISGTEFDRTFMNNGLLNAHNWVLMLAVWGGIVAVAIFILLVVVACREAASSKGTAYYRIVVLHLIVLSVRFLVEGGMLATYLFAFSMLAYSPEFIRCISSLPKPKGKGHRVKITFKPSRTVAWGTNNRKSAE